MTWEQEIQLARADERERHQKIIAEKDCEIAELKAKLAALGESSQKA